MPAGVRARHRTTNRALTPLSELTDTFTDRMHTVGRTGIILAMSSGMVSSMALPADARTGPAPVASVPTLDRAPAGAPVSAATQVPSDDEDAEPLSASVDADVTFEGTDGLTAARTPAPRQAARAERAARSLGSEADPSTGSATSPGSATSTVGGSSVLAVAARYVGTPYRYGGTTPSGFDCSGFVRHVFAQLGHSLPRTANEQMNATRRVSRSEARPGDLVFFVSGGRAHHNGIYAGGNMMYDSPRTGKTLQKREIWSSAVVFTRVG